MQTLNSTPNPATNPTANPLLDFSDLPRFADVLPEQVGPAVTQLIEQARAAVAQVTAANTPTSWENVITPLEQATEQLGRAWGMVGHLNSVMDSPALRAAYNENLPIVTAFWTELGQNLALYNQYKALAAQPEFKTLPAARQQIIHHALRDFRLSGAELTGSAQTRFAEIQEEQAALAQKFSENVLDATNDFALYISDEAELAGMPADDLAAMQAAAEKDGKSGWKITLHLPSYSPVMQYADNRNLREQLYRAYVTRASEFPNQHDKLWDNTPLITQLLALRQEEAQLLGYQSFAEVSLVSKMAESPAQVINFLHGLAQRARPYAERDVAELRQFAANELGLTDLQAWDVPYASEKLRQQRYAFSENEVKQYFPEPQVLAGLFRVIQTLFGVQIKADTFPTWHPSVRTFRIEKPNGELVGQFYLDPYARAGKRGGAWMDDVRGRKRTTTGLQTPIAHLVCNFPEPVGNKPALLTHDDVITLFHECGHGLHHLLTQVEDLGVSGISGVEWDAVELPSQFMENFCWEWEVLQGMTQHVESGAPLPRALYDKMLAAKNFQSGMQTLRQIEFSLFDMQLHAATHTVTNPQDLLDQIRAQIAVMTPPIYNRFQNSFSHIFAGGYAAGYYSYKWAEVLSADAYAQFEETGVLNPLTGQQYWREILGVGGSRPALDSFQAFRGRKPTLDALLRHNGMLEASTALPETR